MKTKKTIVKLIKLILLVIGSILIVFSFFQMLRGDFFKINQVVCFDSPDKDSPCQAELWFRVNRLVLGKNIILLSPPEVEQLIKSELPGIDQVETEKRLPNKLIVCLTKRKPIAVVEANSDYYEVDYQGIILTKLEQPTNLPLIASGEISVMATNHRLESPVILSSLDLLYQLLVSNIETRRLEITNSRELAVFLKTGPKVLISLDKNIKEQVESLQLILERAKIEGKQIQLIDLRFDKPVINYG